MQRTARERAAVLLEASFAGAAAAAASLSAAATLAKDAKTAVPTVTPTVAAPPVLCYVCEDDIRSQPLIRCTRTCTRSVHAACWPTLRDAPADARDSAAASFACTTCRMQDGDVELFRAAAGSLTVRVDAALETTADTCKSCGGLGELVLCDGCDAAYHVTCCGLEGGVPSGDWFCAVCVSARGEKKRKRGAAKALKVPLQAQPPPPPPP